MGLTCVPLVTLALTELGFSFGFFDYKCTFIFARHRAGSKDSQGAAAQAGIHAVLPRMTSHHSDDRNARGKVTGQDQR
jgi:hypothetical protein